MNNISNGMESLCGDIINGHSDRKKDLNELKKDVNALQKDTKNLLEGYRKEHMEAGRRLREELQGNTQELKEKTKNMREGFRQKSAETRTDLANASRIWNNTRETLKGKRRLEKEVR